MASIVAMTASFVLRLVHVPTGRPRAAEPLGPRPEGPLPGGCTECDAAVSILGNEVDDGGARGRTPGGAWAGHAPGAVLRSGRRLRIHAGDDLPHARPDVERAVEGGAAARRDLVGMVRLRVADEHARSGGGRRPASHARGDRGDAHRL